MCGWVSFFCCGRKANLVRIFLLNPNFLLVHRNKLSVTVYLFLALYGSTTIQSQSYLVYNTVVRLSQFFCCGRKANLVRIYLLNPNFLLVHRNKLSVIVYLFLALYGSTTIQSQSFLKNIKNFVWFPKQYSLGFFILEKQLANIPDRGFLFHCNTLLLHLLSHFRETTC